MEAVRIMAKIAERAERDINYSERRLALLKNDQVQATTTTAICHASCDVAEEIGATAIIAVTLSGYTAASLSRLRPMVPIIGCTTNARTACQMNLLFGVVPLIINMEEETEALMTEAVRRADLTGLVKQGDKVVLTAGLPLGTSGKTNLVRVVEI